MKWGKVATVICGALIVTALGIDAADTFSGSGGTMLSQVIGRNAEGGCPEGMVALTTVPGVSCADRYEVSTGEKCPKQNPEQMPATLENVNTAECQGVSREGTVPWRFITRDQAMQMCARAGKRLPTSDEWYALGLGMANPEASCNTSSHSVSVSGKFPNCISPSGLFDLVGNVWEWVSDDVMNGSYKSTTVPETGYVSQVDAGGMAVMVSDSPSDLFEKDYFWSRSDGAYGIIRGGYYDSSSDGGLYAVHADTPPTTAGTGIGFRCVK